MRCLCLLLLAGCATTPFISVEEVAPESTPSVETVTIGKPLDRSPPDLSIFWLIVGSAAVWYVLKED
jgi:esterase/lipase superfamily enzyme